MADPAAWHGKRLQLHGYVVERSSSKRELARLPLQGAEQRAASSRPATPASCPTRSRTAPRSCSRARSSADGFDVEPNGVMAKCPSKYEPSEARRRRRTPPSSSAARSAVTRNTPCLRSEISLLLAAFVVVRLRDRRVGRRRAAPLDAPDRERHRRVLSRHRADDGRVRRASSTPSSPTTTRSSTSSATRTRRSRWPTRSPRTGAGSTARSCSGCSCSASSARSRSTSTASAIAS